MTLWTSNTFSTLFAVSSNAVRYVPVNVQSCTYSRSQRNTTHNISQRQHPWGPRMFFKRFLDGGRCIVIEFGLEMSRGTTTKDVPQIRNDDLHGVDVCLEILESHGSWRRQTKMCFLIVP